MSGFDEDWLALREPADMAARDSSIMDILSSHLETSNTPLILDIGCGTGSTYRALKAHVPTSTKWLLLDHDEKLLSEARRRMGAKDALSFRLHDLGRLDDLPLEAGSMVTASALFDLASESFCDAFCEKLIDAHCGLYAALNYDGKITWSLRHHLDDKMVGAFNRHQQTDKGFGLALGPKATDCLNDLFQAKGYDTTIRPSPWKMGPLEKDLHAAFLEGFRQPLEEMLVDSKAEIDDWLAYRLSVIDHPDGLCEVGHSDIIALPA